MYNWDRSVGYSLFHCLFLLHLIFSNGTTFVENKYFKAACISGV